MARATRHLADRVDHAAGALHRELGVTFRGHIADEHRETLRGREHDARTTAQQLRDAAGALDAHADAVEARLHQLHQLERWFASQLHEAQHTLGRLAGIAKDGLDQLTGAAEHEARRVVDAARHMPPPGSLEWERFTAGLRR